MALQWRDQHLQLQQKLIWQAHEQIVLSTALVRNFREKNFFDDFHSIFNLKHFESFFHRINNLHQNNKFPMEEERNVKLVFLDYLLKRNNGKIFVLIYVKHTHTARYLHCGSHHQPSCKESVVSSLIK